MAIPGRKLLVLDVNGLLVNTYRGQPRPKHQHDKKVGKLYVYKRPFCDEFIQFCLEHFVVGVWSTAKEENVLALVDYLFKDAKEKLAFIWHQEQCTNTDLRHPDNHYKPIFLKELWRLWKPQQFSVPWREGSFGPSNTLLVDDTAYKAVNNPPHTAIFPKSYSAYDQDDNCLEKELCTYLKGLLRSSDVQAYVQQHPIFEPCVAMGDPKWSQIFASVKVQSQGKYVIPRHRLGYSVSVIPDCGPSSPQGR